MGLTDLLTTVDEAIWRQFEKITLKAEKELGWSKYDLAHKANIVEGCAGLSCLTYITASGVMMNDFKYMLLGIGVAPVAVYNHFQNRKIIEQREKSELYSSIGGVVEAPLFGPFRPIAGAMGTLAISQGIFGLSFSPTPEVSKQQIVAYGLMIVAIGAAYVFRETGDYFLTQIPRPPSAKKTVWQFVKEKVAFGSVSVPQEAMNKYVGLEEKLNE